MGSVKFDRGSLATVISTDLNSLADEANAVSSEIDNSVTDSYPYASLELVLGTVGYAHSAGATVEVYMMAAMDGTNYSDGSSSIDPPAHNLVAVICVRSVTSARRHWFQRVDLPPHKVKFVVINKTGQTWNASGNTFAYQPYRFIS